jgi:hypothetical protein
MSGENKKFCTITFMDGKKIQFRFQPIRNEEDPTLGMAVEKLANSQSLVFELEEKLMFVPMNNVRTVEVSPAPAKLPANIIRGAMIDQNL